MQTSRPRHGLFAEGNMVVKSDNFDQVGAAFFLRVLRVLQVFPNNLLKSVDNKLFLKARVCLLSVDELFISFVLIFEPLQLEESEGKPESGAIRVFLDSDLIHSFQLP